MHYTSLSIALIIGLMAGSTHAETARIKHYMPDQPKNIQAAMASLHNESHKITLLLAKHPVLSAAQLEAIHEISYQLEAAQETLNRHSDTKNVATSLRAPIEALHEESEEHDEHGTRQAFDALQRALSEMHHEVAVAQ